MIDPRTIIARQIDRSGNTLMAALEPLSDEDFYAINADGYSAAWTVGHLACVADLFSSWFDGQLLIGPELHQLFNDTSIADVIDPAVRCTVTADRCSKSLLLSLLRQSVTRALRVLNAFDPGDWDKPGPARIPLSMGTGGGVWEHLAVHITWHMGQLAGSMARFYGTYTLNIAPHYFYEPPGNPGTWLPHSPSSPDKQPRS